MFVIHRTPTLSLRIGKIIAANGRLFSQNDSSDDEKKHAKKSKKTLEPQQKSSESASERLNRLLASMQMDDNTSNFAKSVEMVKPGEGFKKRKESAKQRAANKDVFSAAKQVAALMGDETSKKQTESELLNKLLDHSAGNARVGAEINEGAKNGEASELSLADLIVGMKIDRRQQPKEQTRGDFVRRTLNVKGQSNASSTNYNNRKPRKREAESFTGSVNLFGGEHLGIFKDVAQLKESPDMLKTWSMLHQHELQQQVTHPPSNYYEKIALWTEQNKVWKFPIDNEQGLDEEASVDFSEHIFLEQHLEPWCPEKGPIRHFMELVCVGLSKNYHITAREKKEHILWYRDYFEEKKEMLKDLMNKEKMNQIAKDKSSQQKLEA